MKKYISLLLVVIILAMSMTSYAAYSDVPKKAGYADAVDRLAAMGIMEAVSGDKFQPNAMVTRKQFCSIMVNATGLKESSETLKGTSVFPDVSPEDPSSGYINQAIAKGYITGMADGKFHPNEPITFAQVCTVLVRVLGYSEQDVPGIWPKNYIEKAKILGLIDGINLKSTAGVPRSTMALMVDKLLVTNIKKNNAGEADKTYADSIGLYTSCIILGNSLTTDTLNASQVLTDKGIYTVDKGVKLELGNKYSAVVKDGVIQKALKGEKALLNISVDSVIDTKITYIADNKKQSMNLTDKTTYYYKGAKQSYDSLKTLLQANSSLVFAYNSDKSGYDYVIVADPLYSKPEVAKNYDPAARRIGSLSFDDAREIVRNGEIVSAKDIANYDVVYKVSDIWNSRSYIMAVNSQVTGKITAILPNKISPKTLQIDNKSYEISKDMDFTKVSSSISSWKINDYVTLLLGHDGKVVDVIYPNSEDNSNYAVVINYTSSTSSGIQDYGKVSYTVKLLLTNGTTATYKINSDPAELKGKLVSYGMLDNETVTIVPFTYTAPGEVVVQKDAKQLGESVITDDIKIFNIITNPVNGDCQASVLNWSDLPGGVLQSGKVMHISRTGIFADVNLLLLNDVFDQVYKTAYVKKVDVVKAGRTNNYVHTLLIDGKEYSFTATVSYVVDTLVKVNFTAGTVNYVVTTQLPDMSSGRISAIDSKRIKLANTVYWFKSNITIYYMDLTGAITLKGINDIDTAKTYNTVSVYLDKPIASSGKVEAVFIKE